MTQSMRQRLSRYICCGIMCFTGSLDKSHCLQEEHCSHKRTDHGGTHKEIWKYHKTSMAFIPGMTPEDAQHPKQRLHGDVPESLFWSSLFEGKSPISEEAVSVLHFLLPVTGYHGKHLVCGTKFPPPAQSLSVLVITSKSLTQTKVSYFILTLPRPSTNWGPQRHTTKVAASNYNIIFSLDLFCRRQGKWWDSLCSGHQGTLPRLLHLARNQGSLKRRELQT